MRKIGIELYRITDLQPALLDVAKAIRQNYGAGTITNPHKNRDYDDEDFYGFWTSIPNKEWKALVESHDTVSFVIDAGKNIDEYEMARFVESFKL